jgi:formimidoylglutamate deiminase
MNSLFAEHALLPSGWAQAVLLTWDTSGKLTAVKPNSQAEPDSERIKGPLLPGMPNLHSHAFQRAFAGLTEYRSAASQDSFWSWREAMYAFAARISPEQLEAIASHLYIEMLSAGYTSVCEFHYLHHDQGGKPYADALTLSHCLLRAAKRSGIGFTLLPVLYQSSGFGEHSARAEQARFINSSEAYLRLFAALQSPCTEQGASLGFAPHSLRAVPPASLADVLTGVNALAPSSPIHIHIAEQQAEVAACLNWSAQRPVQWLLNNAAVDDRWCLVHATHLSATESTAAAKTGAVAGLCPSTEANLGDGIFNFPAWPGRWGIGSDSHICVNAAEELMSLEYSQRLQTGQRNVCATTAHSDVAVALYLAANQGGAQASGRAIAGLAVGQQADWLVLNAEHPSLAGLPSSAAQLANHLFASHRSSAIDSVWVGGKRLIEQGQHSLQHPAQTAFAQVRQQLLKGN